LNNSSSSLSSTFDQAAASKGQHFLLMEQLILGSLVHQEMARRAGLSQQMLVGEEQAGPKE